ncbi:MAG: diphthamide biosynthesis enzyme Dph2 [Candidatus Micrarchaeota archaeon]
MRILLQFPEGLKRLALEEAGRLERKGNEVFISSSPCFGACDIALDEARAIRAKKIIHWGHSDFGVKAGIPVEYVEYPIPVDLKRVLPKVLLKLREFGRVGLVTTVQHIPQLKDLRRELQKHGKTVLVSKGTRTKYPGQILGCDVGAAKSIDDRVDCFLYLGGGFFHPLMDVESPVLKADPFSGEVKWMDDGIRQARRRRKGAMAALISAKNVGILISTKTGQKDIRCSLAVKRRLERTDKRCVLLVSNFVDFASLTNFGKLDCYVNTACPRLSDDYELAGKRIINYRDAMIVAKILEGKR